MKEELFDAETMAVPNWFTRNASLLIVKRLAEQERMSSVPVLDITILNARFLQKHSEPRLLFIGQLACIRLCAH